jgi:hypothetical protein
MRRIINQVVSPEKLDTIKILHYKGFSNREIGKVLQYHHDIITKCLKQDGLESNFNSSVPIQMVSKTKACCSRCHDVKPLKEFQKGRVGTDKEYIFSYCNKCRRKQLVKNMNRDDVRVFLGDRHNRLKLRCKKKGIHCTLTREQLIEIFQKQNGLCFYTDAVLICEAGSKLHRDSMSIDKIIPEKGYTIDNVVLTTHRINTCKCDLSLDEIQKWMPSFFERIQKHLTHKESI